MTTLAMYTSFTVNNAVRKWNVRPSTCRMTQWVDDCPEETLLYSNIVTAACAAISLRVGQVLQKYPLSWRICTKKRRTSTLRSRPSESDRSRAVISLLCTVAILTKLTNNKCIGDDTKAAARQSLNCIKNKNKIKYGITQFSIWRIEFLHPAMWHVALGWHAIEFAQTSAILEFYIWFRFRPITAVDMSFCTSLRNFIQIGQPSAEKKLRHVDFQDGRSQSSWILGIQWWVLWKSQLHNFL